MNKNWKVVILVLAVSCVSESIEEGYLQPDVMASIILDIYESENRLSYKSAGFDAKDMWPEYKKIIYERHGVTDSVYNVNIAYYLTNPRLLDKVYDQVIDSLTLKQQKQQVEKDKSIDEKNSVEPK